MIYGIGHDLVRIERIANAIEQHGQRFVERILVNDELLMYRQRHAHDAARGIVFVATRFAAKEAFAKAIGLGMHHPMSWRAVEILNQPSGQPYVVTQGALLDWMERRHLQAHITITDEIDYTSAFAVVEII